MHTVFRFLFPPVLIGNKRPKCHSLHYYYKNTNTAIFPCITDFSFWWWSYTIASCAAAYGRFDIFNRRLHISLQCSVSTNIRNFENRQRSGAELHDLSRFCGPLLLFLFRQLIFAEDKTVLPSIPAASILPYSTPFMPKGRQTGQICLYLSVHCPYQLARTLSIHLRHTSHVSTKTYATLNHILIVNSRCPSCQACDNVYR